MARHLAKGFGREIEGFTVFPIDLDVVHLVDGHLVDGISHDEQNRARFYRTRHSSRIKTRDEGIKTIGFSLHGETLLDYSSDLKILEKKKSSKIPYQIYIRILRVAHIRDKNPRFH